MSTVSLGMTTSAWLKPLPAQPRVVRPAPNEVEAHALKESLHWIIQLQLGNILVKMDCKSVVDAFHSHKADLSEFGCLIANCRRLASFVENLTLFFAKWQANSVAHALARAA